MTQPTRVIVTFGRSRATIFAVCLLALLWFSVQTALHGPATDRWSREAVIVVFTICSTLFGLGFLLSAAQIVKPGRLILSAEGFRVDWLLSLPLIPWSAVAAFDLVRQGPTSHVCFRLTREAAGRLGRPWWRFVAPPGFDGCACSASPGMSRRVLAELVQWRERFSPPTAL